jgi:hypothetical protein
MNYKQQSDDIKAQVGIVKVDNRFG